MSGLLIILFKFLSVRSTQKMILQGVKGLAKNTKTQVDDKAIESIEDILGIKTDYLTEQARKAVEAKKD